MAFFSHTGSNVHLRATGNYHYYTKKERQDYRDRQQKEKVQREYEKENPISMGSNGFDD